MNQETLSNSVVYTRVPAFKVFIMCVCTLGLYIIPWAYRNWKVYSALEGKDISPVARTIFWNLICFPLFKSIYKSTGMAALFFVLMWLPAIMPQIFLRAYMTNMHATLFMVPTMAWIVLAQVVYVSLVLTVIQLKINSQSDASYDIKKCTGFGPGTCVAIILGALAWYGIHYRMSATRNQMLMIQSGSVMGGIMAPTTPAKNN
jgi:hypothetical protein